MPHFGVWEFVRPSEASQKVRRSPNAGSHSHRDTTMHSEGGYHAFIGSYYATKNVLRPTMLSEGPTTVSKGPAMLSLSEGPTMPSVYCLGYYRSTMLSERPTILACSQGVLPCAQRTLYLAARSQMQRDHTIQLLTFSECLTMCSKPFHELRGSLPCTQSIAAMLSDGTAMSQKVLHALIGSYRALKGFHHAIRGPYHAFRWPTIPF